MTCPTTTDLAALAVGDPDVRFQEHVAGCPACAAQLADLRTTLTRLAAAHAAPGNGHEAGRARLLAALAAEPVPARPTLLRRIVMDRRTWASSAAVAAAVVVAAFLSWGGTPAIALADAVQPFREAKSFSCTLVPLQDGKPAPGAERMSIQLTWAAPGSLRTEARFGGQPQMAVIAPHGRPGVTLTHGNKTYLPVEGPPGRQEAALLKVIHGLATTPGGDQRPAGVDEIGQVKAPRFNLTVADPAGEVPPWQGRVWVHPKTKRPLRVEFALQSGQDPAGQGVSGVRLEAFEWNVKTDGLFDTTPPAGYTRRAGGGVVMPGP